LPKSHSTAQFKEHNRSKSLHFNARKLEQERIERENLKIASRIFDLKPSFQITEMEHDFRQHKRYSDGLRKFMKRKSIPRHGGKAGHLPPLSSTAEEDQAMQLAGELNHSTADKQLFERENTFEEPPRRVKKGVE
jgi:hypothetical protein